MVDETLLDYPHNANFPVREPEGVEVHPSAIVSENAVVGSGVRVGPYAVVGPNVVLRKGVHLAAHVVIGGRTTVDEGTRIFPFATIGSTPQNLKSKETVHELLIGPRNTIREYANISGSSRKGSKTVVGSDNFLMAYSHVGHDCVIGDDCVLTNGVNIAGHAEIGDGAVLGGMCGVHQFGRVGKLAMVSGGSMVNKDVPPFCLVTGDRARIVSLNLVGLKRAGYAASEIKDLKEMFGLLFKCGLTLEEALARIGEEVSPSPAKTTFLDFLRSTRRGICR